MELSEKIRRLRKEQGLTQEQFAQQLFVSRTAVSKWETGRGVPNMDSLQVIARLCGITIDELLCAEEVIKIAKRENKENIKRFAFCIDGVLNIAAIIGVFLPLYKVERNNIFYSVPLCQFEGWLAVFYWILPVAMAICGVILIATYKSERDKLKKSINIIGIILNICAILLLILSGQPYPAVMFFVLFMLKGAVILMKQK